MSTSSVSCLWSHTHITSWLIFGAAQNRKSSWNPCEVCRQVFLYLKHQSRIPYGNHTAHIWRVCFSAYGYVFVLLTNFSIVLPTRYGMEVVRIVCRTCEKASFHAERTFPSDRVITQDVNRFGAFNRTVFMKAGIYAISLSPERIQTFHNLNFFRIDMVNMCYKLC